MSSKYAKDVNPGDTLYWYIGADVHRFRVIAAHVSSPKEREFKLEDLDTGDVFFDRKPAGVRISTSKADLTGVAEDDATIETHARIAGMGSCRTPHMR